MKSTLIAIMIIMMKCSFLQLPDPQEMVAPLISPAKVQIGGMTPNGFGPKKIQGYNYNYPRMPSDDSCPCASEVERQCPSCFNDHYTDYQLQMAMMQCDCAPKPKCPPCPNVMENIQQNEVNEAKQDFSESDKLKQSAQQQAELYDQIERLDRNMIEEEKKAMEANKLMNEASQNVENMKQQMQKLKAKARELAEQTLFQLNPSSPIQTQPYMNNSPYLPVNVNPLTQPIRPLEG